MRDAQSNELRFFNDTGLTKLFVCEEEIILNEFIRALDTKINGNY